MCKDKLIDTKEDVYILGIESSCDDTSAAVTKNRRVLSNIIADQDIHRDYGGVVPEFASRAHQQHIVPVVERALKEAGVKKEQLSAIAFTRGPGLLGSLLVGTSFAKAFAMGLNIPILEADHLNAHILAHFIQKDTPPPQLPFLCLTVSGGHSQIVRVDSPEKMTVIGHTIDDAAGETFDKAAKIMGLPYPGGPIIDKLAQQGNPNKYQFAKPKIPNLNYSFSGLKTSFLYFVRDQLKKDKQFVEKEKNHLCASIQKTIVEILMKKLILACKETKISEVAVAGGVAANSELRKTLKITGKQYQWNIHVPEISYTTDNAAMIAITGYFKYLQQDFAPMTTAPYTRSL